MPKPAPQSFPLIPLASPDLNFTPENAFIDACMADLKAHEENDFEGTLEVVPAAESDSAIPSDDYNLMIVAGSKEKASKGFTSNRSLFMLPPNKIKQLEGFNVRIKNADYWLKVRELADSIIANGYYLHKPIACIVIKQNAEDVIAVTDGYTRHDAVMLCIQEGHPIENIPCVLQPAQNLTDITVGLVTSNSGRQLAPREIGIVCRRLQGYGLDNTTISKRLALSIAYIGQLLSLDAAPREILEMVDNGEVSATLAVQTLKDEGEAAVKVLQGALKDAKEQGKDKVTKKNLKAEKPSKPDKIKPTKKEPEKSNEESLIISKQFAIEKGIEWFKTTDYVYTSSHYELMQAITGASVDVIKLLLAD